jgi:hypothetical protein
MGWSGPMTHRQCLAWHYWSREDFNTPSRSDYYLIQLTAVVAGMFTRVKMSDFILKFGDSKRNLISREQAGAYARAKWFVALGIDPSVLEKSSNCD